MGKSTHGEIYPRHNPREKLENASSSITDAILGMTGID